MKPQTLSTKSSAQKLTLESALEAFRSCMGSVEEYLSFVVTAKADALLRSEGLLDRAHLEALATLLYGYGVEGRAIEDFDESYFIDFVYFLRLAKSAAGYMPGPVPVTNAEEVACTVHARRKLDFFSGYEPFTCMPATERSEDFFYAESSQFADGEEKKLSLGEIALLARMDEKSVRNMTHATQEGEHRLATTKIGSKTMVEIPEAIRWLRLRKGFHLSAWMER